MLPLQNITAMTTPPVMHPPSRRCRTIYSAATILSESYPVLAFIGFPLSAFARFSAHEKVMLVFGNQWEPSIPVFRTLALSVGIHIILPSSGLYIQLSEEYDIVQRLKSIHITKL